MSQHGVTSHSVQGDEFINTQAKYDDKSHSEHIDQIATLDPETGKKYRANNQLDDAARLLEEAGGSIEYTVEDQKRVLRKIDLYVCLPMCMVYFIQQVSKAIEIGSHN
jgi:hypothetical protein